MSQQKLMDIYKRLYEHYGPQHWWPGQSCFEIIIGAILTQNTNWRNVEKAITNLKVKGCLSPEKLHHMPADEIAVLIRPAGYFNLKSRRLKGFLEWLFEKHDGSLANLELLPPSTLRQQLLSIKGIGPETADSICLYAFGKPVFVVDAYSARILGRHGFLEPGCGYQDIQELFHSSLDRDADLFNDFHALLVQVGKQHCKRKPLCHGCPLEDLPHHLESEMF